jgi:hypothetical protein
MTTALGTAQLCAILERMKRLIPVAVCVVLASVGCSLGGDDGEPNPVEDEDFVFDIVRPFITTEEEPYGEAGASAEGEGKTRVVISLHDPPAGVLNADIRPGDCLGSLGAAVHYDLEDVVDGESESVVDVPLEELLERGYVVFIGDWDREGQLCGDFFGAEEN